MQVSYHLRSGVWRGWEALFLGIFPAWQLGCGTHKGTTLLCFMMLFIPDASFRIDTVSPAWDAPRGSPVRPRLPSWACRLPPRLSSLSTASSGLLSSLRRGLFLSSGCLQFDSTGNKGAEILSPSWDDTYFWFPKLLKLSPHINKSCQSF